MNMNILNRRIEALLDDPMISLMIRADGVDRAALARQLGALGQSVGTRPLRDDRPRRAKPQGHWTGRAFALCGACAP